MKDIRTQSCYSTKTEHFLLFLDLAISWSPFLPIYPSLCIAGREKKVPQDSEPSTLFLKHSVIPSQRVSRDERVNWCHFAVVCMHVPKSFWV